MPSPIRRIRGRAASGASSTSDRYHWRPPSCTKSVRNATKRIAPPVWTAEPKPVEGGPGRRRGRTGLERVACPLDDVEALLEEAEASVAVRELVHEPRRRGDEVPRLVHERRDEQVREHERGHGRDREADPHRRAALEAAALEHLHERLRRHRQHDRDDELEQDRARGVDERDERKARR